jgi:hypothetical protein
MSDTVQPADVSKPNPVLIMAAILAAANVIVAGLVQLDMIDEGWLAILNLVVAALTVAYGVVTRGQVAPWADVAAKASPNGGLVAGPASNVATGTPVLVSDTAVPPGPPEAGVA